MRSSKHNRTPAGGVRRSTGKPNGSEVRNLSVQPVAKKRGRPTKAAATSPSVYAYGYHDNEWQDGGVRGRVLICGKPASGKSYLLAERVRACRRVILFNSAGVDSFNSLGDFVPVSRPGDLKQLLLATYPDGPLRVVYTPQGGSKTEHFDLVCRMVKVCGHVVFAVDEIDLFMTANDLGEPSFYELTNYGRHLRVAIIGTTRNTVAVSRQFTSMLTEIDVFATTEPRYLKYFEDSCGGGVSDAVPLLGKHEYIRWMADGSGSCLPKKGWGSDG